MKIHSIYKIICIFLFRDEIIINKPILAYLPIRRAVVFDTSARAYARARLRHVFA